MTSALALIERRTIRQSYGGLAGKFAASKNLLRSDVVSAIFEPSLKSHCHLKDLVILDKVADMDSTEAVRALGALAHEARLAIFRILVECGPGGLPAGVIAEQLGMPPSSLTFHVQHLHQAGLVTQRRVSRQRIYAADIARINGLLDFLIKNCCRGGLSACSPTAPAKSAITPPKVAS